MYKNLQIQLSLQKFFFVRRIQEVAQFWKSLQSGPTSNPTAISTTYTVEVYICYMQ